MSPRRAHCREHLGGYSPATSQSSAGEKCFEHSVGAATRGASRPYCEGPKEFRRRPVRWPSGCRRNCCDGVQISARPSLTQPQRPPALGLPKPISIRRLFLLGDIGVQASDAARLFAPGSLFYAAGPGFTWSILNYGRITNNVGLRTHVFSKRSSTTRIQCSKPRRKSKTH